MSRQRLSRRSILTLGAAGLLLPRFGRADVVSGNRRRFLFLHCAGGWDTTTCFQPNFGSSVVEMEADATQAEVGGISFVDHAARPNVRAFFERYAPQTCVINGIEVRSITHERCHRIMMTGSADGETDDWGAILAGKSTEHHLLPYLVQSGTAFSAAHSQGVVRVGNAGQLSRLLDGSVLTEAEGQYPLPSAGRASTVDAFVRRRMADAAPQSPIASAATRALSDAEALARYAGDLDIGATGGGCYQLQNNIASVWDVFSEGLARSALVKYSGWCSEGWDTHTQNGRQALHFDELFQALGLALDDLATRPAIGGGSLADETVIVVLSEMGRTPRLTSLGGRDHWTFTSAMVVGAGVRGGQVVGGYDSSGFGAGCDFTTGQVSASGQGILAGNFGATVLALGDVDPGENAPISAVLG
ncbi:MAG: DUF1501 domain-containing protein [Myxococcales bacterium]|nr:DUF1501 domain-containing protein [Myxococcales bacterium]